MERLKRFLVGLWWSIFTVVCTLAIVFIFWFLALPGILTIWRTLWD
jgi:hypothetical protein